MSDLDLDSLQERARRDDWHQTISPGEIRVLIGEARRLREAYAGEKKLRERMDRRWNASQEFLEQERETTRCLARALDEQNAKLDRARAGSQHRGEP